MELRGQGYKDCDINESGGESSILFRTSELEDNEGKDLWLPNSKDLNTYIVIPQRSERHSFGPLQMNNLVWVSKIRVLPRDMEERYSDWRGAFPLIFNQSRLHWDTAREELAVECRGDVLLNLARRNNNNVYIT